MGQKKNNNTGKVLAAAAVGAAAGVAAVLLSKKENRDKVAKTAGDLKKGAEEQGKALKDKFEKSDTGKDVMKKVDQTRKEFE